MGKKNKRKKGSEVKKNLAKKKAKKTKEDLPPIEIHAQDLDDKKKMSCELKIPHPHLKSDGLPGLPLNSFRKQARHGLFIWSTEHKKVARAEKLNQ